MSLYFPMLFLTMYFLLSTFASPAKASAKEGLFYQKTNMSQIQEFNDYRAKMNEVILGKQNKVINRLFNLDTNTYAEGALSTKTKEMLGLVASMVLRCDDCIKYHLGKCHEQGITTDEMYEIFAVANIVGGTIVIPHTRRAAEYWEELNTNNNT
jgi:AhpD family alkylhydroperoxidase